MSCARCEVATSAEGVLLVDTSAAVALTVADHEHHEDTFAQLGGRRLGLAGHAAFAGRGSRALETYRALGIEIEFLS
jgi:hypothetical protein